MLVFESGLSSKGTAEGRDSSDGKAVTGEWDRVIAGCCPGRVPWLELLGKVITFAVSHFSPSALCEI